jgi:hypothetical protein
VSLRAEGRSGQQRVGQEGSGLPKRWCAVMLMACSCRNGSKLVRPEVVTTRQIATSGSPSSTVASAGHRRADGSVPAGPRTAGGMLQRSVPISRTGCRWGGRTEPNRRSSPAATGTAELIESEAPASIAAAIVRTSWAGRSPRPGGTVARHGW